MEFNQGHKYEDLLEKKNLIQIVENYHLIAALNLVDKVITDRFVLRRIMHE